MVEFQAFVCDPFTGAQIERIDVAGFSGSQLLSAKGTADVTVPLTAAQPKEVLRPLLEPRRYLIVLVRDGVAKYGGWVIPGSYRRGVSSVRVTLGDLWSLLGRRAMTAPGVVNLEKWSYWIENQPRAAHAALLLTWNRDRGVVPSSTFPLTIPGGWSGELVTRPYYGYEMTYLAAKLGQLMDEGLDIFFEPQWVSGQFRWVMRAGDDWGTGVVREFDVTADQSEVLEFSEQFDGEGVTNNAIRVGEGSEVDLLARSYPNVSSPLPLLERITMSKTVSDADQLSQTAQQDLVTFGAATVQWDFKLAADTPIGVGDTVRMTFADDPWVPDGIYTRRVVKVTHDMTDQVAVAVQPVGGA